MSKRHWTITKLERILLAACGSFWFHGCQDTQQVSGPLYGVTPPPSSEQWSGEASSSSIGGVQPVYGVIYSSATQSQSSSSLGEVMSYYGIIRPMSVDASSSSKASSSSTPASSGVASSAEVTTPSSSSLSVVYPLYGIVRTPSSSSQQ